MVWPQLVTALPYYNTFQIVFFNHKYFTALSQVPISVLYFAELSHSIACRNLVVISQECDQTIKVDRKVTKYIIYYIFFFFVNKVFELMIILQHTDRTMYLLSCLCFRRKKALFYAHSHSLPKCNELYTKFLCQINVQFLHLNLKTKI